jgi:hypothetical protein
MKKLIFALTCLFLAVPCQARVITVDDDEPADFNTIQAAIDDSNDGDTIIVADGIYTGNGNRDIDFRKYDHGLPPGPTRAITVRSANGPGNCIIDCNGTESDPHGGFRFENGEDSNSVIMGFTIINGFARCESFAPPFAVCEYLGGAIYCWRSSPTISNCIISGNTARYGGGIACYKGNPTVSNCIFVGNCASDGGGMGILNGSDAKIINCTFSGNVAYHVGGGILNGSIMGQVEPEQPKLINCIHWGSSPDEINVSNGTPVITYSNVVGGWAGDGNIDVDPCFIEPGHWEDPCNTPTMPWDDIWIHGDYHLQSQAGRWNTNSQSWVQDDVSSLCIDAGDPNSDWTAELWPHGKRINMGAYGGTPQASMSQLDIGNIANLDNDVNDIVNSLDLALFVGKWCYEEFLLAEDLNRDGFVNFNDFAIFGLQWSYPSASEPSMTFHVDDCNMAEGQSQPVVTESNEPRFSVWVEGRYIYFEDQMYANCCPVELEVQMTVEGDLITIYEIEHTSMPCPCMCDYPITATFGPFEDGTYTVEVYDNYGNSLGVVEVTIGGSPEPGMTFQVDECSLFSAAEQASETRFTITVEGRYIHFEDTMTANCCPYELGLEMTVEKSIITIYETEDIPGGCRCMCTYPVTATLGPFEPGAYTLEVYETTGGFIGSTTVVIDPPQ